MTSLITNHKKRVLLANLTAGYLFVLLPLIILVLIKLLHFKSWQSILLAGDWSLASCIIFGQNVANLSKAVVARGKEIQSSMFVFYFARRLVGVVISLVIYILNYLETDTDLKDLKI